MTNIRTVFARDEVPSIHHAHGLNEEFQQALPLGKPEALPNEFAPIGLAGKTAGIQRVFTLYHE